jgi:asparagine synthase (glutamine-hydrolysing)
MLSVLAHRGPDGSAVWSGDHAALGQASLWTTPESRRERGPLTNETRDLSIAADARLDNRRELMAALGLAGASAAGLSDGELILRVYARWGERGVARLIGDFAFVIWDGRAQTLVCARDHIGVKPLYYYRGPGIVLVASEIKALLTNPLVPYRLNPLRVADHLAGFFDDRTITFYRDVFRLPPGHTLTVSRDGTHIRPYWSLDPTRELVLGSDDAYADAFRECFTEAVACRLRSSGPVGCLLSGGLDTSSIVATAREVRRGVADGNLDTFSAIFPGLSGPDLKPIDERRYVDAVVAQGGLEAHYVRGDQIGPLTDVDRMLWHLDEAFVAPNLFMHWGLYGAARDLGIRALLDGLDGDTTVSHGLEYLPALARAGRLGTLTRELRALSRRYGTSVRSLVWRFCVPPLVPPALRQSIRALRGHTPSAWTADTVIRPEFARQVGIAERMELGDRRRRQPARSAHDAHARGMNSPLIQHALELADSAAAAFGLEARYPFFDRRLMELCLSLPPDQKLSQGWTRRVMRRAMRGLLPEEVRWRPGKANLSPNFLRQLAERHRELVAEVVLEHPAILEDYVDVERLRRTYDRYAARPMREADALTIYRAVVLALWLRRTKITP